MQPHQYASKNYGREIAFILFSQKWIGLIAAFLVVAATFTVVLGVTPKYEAVGTFLVKGKKTDADPGSLEKGQVRIREVSKADLYSEVEILVSGEVTKRTALELIPKGLWRMVGIPKDSSDGYLIDMLQARLASRLTTEVVPSSNVVEARLRWPDPKDAELILDTLMRNYLDYRDTIFNPQGVGEFFNEQVDNYQKALDEKQQELMDIVSRTNAPDAEAEIKQNLELKASLERQKGDIEREYVETKAFIGQVEAALGSHRIQYFGFINNDTVRGLGSRLQDVMMKREQLRQLSETRAVRRDSSTSDKRLDEIEAARDKAIDQQVSSLQNQLRAEVRAVLEDRRSRLAGFEERRKALDTRLDEIEKRNVELKKAQMRADWLRQETALLTESFKTFFQRREEANLSQSRDEEQSFVIILQKAEGNPTPVFPNERRLVPLGMLAALFTGISIAFLAHFFDQTVKRPEDVEAVLGVPVLFSISEQGGSWERKISRFQTKVAKDRPHKPAGDGGAWRVVVFGGGGAILAMVAVLGLGLLGLKFADPEIWAEVEYVLFGTGPAAPTSPSMARGKVPAAPGPAAMHKPRPAETASAPVPAVRMETAAPAPSSVPEPMRESELTSPSQPLAVPRFVPGVDVPPPS